MMPKTVAYQRVHFLYCYYNELYTGLDFANIKLDNNYKGNIDDMYKIVIKFPEFYTYKHRDKLILSKERLIRNKIIEK